MYVVVTELSGKVKEVLRRARLCDYLIRGVTTLELLQLVPDPTAGKLQKKQQHYSFKIPQLLWPYLVLKGKFTLHTTMKNTIHKCDMCNESRQPLTRLVLCRF